MLRSLAAVILAIFGIAGAAHAQARFDDIRFVVKRTGEGLDDVRAVLTLDTAAKRLRVESGDRALLDVPFDRLTNLHYEQSKYPGGSFWRSRSFLTIHYTNTAGDSAVEIVRLARGPTAGVLQAIERDTGVAVDRGATTTSFLGLPIHVAPGHVVYVTDGNGQRTEGRVTRVSSSSIELGPSVRFDAATVHGIHVKDSIWDGVFDGMIYSILPAYAVSADECWESCDGWAKAASWGVFAAGGVVGALIDRAVMRRAFRRAGSGTSARLQLLPATGNHRAALQFMLRF